MVLRVPIFRLIQGGLPLVSGRTRERRVGGQLSAAESQRAYLQRESVAGNGPDLIEDAIEGLNTLGLGRPGQTGTW
jgi:hypothetical protein